MKQILTMVLILWAGLAMAQTTHAHTETCNFITCTVTLNNMFSSVFPEMSNKEIKEIITPKEEVALKSGSNSEDVSFRGYFYYPSAPADMGMTVAEYESMTRDSITAALDEYYANGEIERNYEINYIGPMDFFSPTDFVDKIHALSATGMGNYAWVNQKRSEYHLAEVGFILPNGYAVDAQGNQASGRAPIIPNANRQLNTYVKSYYQDVISNGIRSIMPHEDAHTYGVHHTISDGNLGGDQNGYAVFVQGQYGTANMPSFNGGAETVNAASSPDLIWQGVQLGSATENAKSVVIDEIEYINGLFEETFICVNDTTVDMGITLQLNIVSNGNEIEYEVLSGNITISGDDLTVNTSGQIVVSAKQNDGSVYWVSDTVSITVNVVQQAPVAVCQNISVSLDEDGSATIFASQIDDGSFDNDGTIVSMKINGSDSLNFTCMNDIVNVTLTVTDNDGLSSSCMATVTVVDDMPPEITCVADFTIQLAAGQDSLFDVNDFIIITSDNCVVYSVTASQTTFSGDTPGTYTVMVSGTDNSDNEISCDLKVTVDQISATIDISQDNRISVFPNPTSGWVNIEIDGTLSVNEVTLYDSAGRIIFESNVVQFSVEHIPKGIYSLVVTTKEDVFVSRLLKLR